MRLKRLLFGTGKDGPWRNLGLVIARVGVAVSLIALHGWSKIPALFAGRIRFLDPLGLGPETSLALAAFAEVVCALAVALGIFARLACVPLVINFAVIVFVVHEAAVPREGGETALLYLVAFTTLLLTGPGRYSLDGWIHPRR